MVTFTPEPRQRVAILLGLPRRQIELLNAVERKLNIGRSQAAELLIDAGFEAVALDGLEQPSRRLAANHSDATGDDVAEAPE
jgi:hypothetical protein